MLFHAPELDDREVEAIERVDELRRRLRTSMARPRRWSGSLRRDALARAIQASNTIEGYVADLDDTIAALEGEDPLGATSETFAAYRGYAEAMTYVLQIADDTHATIDASLVRSLHFMMTSYDLDASPGQWRPGWVGVRDSRTGALVYDAPDATHVPGLIDELAEFLRSSTDHALVQGALAHLNLVMIHPFRDGNGRMARCLQTLVLSRHGVLEPPFSSVEQYLGRHTPEYYKVLADVGGGAWHPENNTRPWLRFMLRAHYDQAQEHQHRIEDAERLWTALESAAKAAGLPDRAVPALYDAALGRRLVNSRYRTILREASGEDVSDQVAGRDLKALVAAGFLDAHGEKRGRRYVAGAALRAIKTQVDSEAAWRLSDNPLEEFFD